MYGYGNSMFLATTGILARGSGGGIDPDAQAFITAASITDPTQQSAINTLVVDLKGYSIWTKFKAIYPIVGGSASSHAVNLKTPGTFNLTYATGVTHSSTGMVGNGSTGYANTNLNAFSTLTLNSTHISFYSRTATITNSQRDMGVFISGNVPCISLGTNTGVEISDHYNFNTNRISSSILSATGFYLGTRTTITSHKLYKNNTTLGTDTTANITTLPNSNIFICGANLTSLGFLSSTKECAFSSIGDGLTDTDAANFYTAVQTYQTTLGRQVGVPIVSDSDAQAFLNAADITDITQANAINDLVIGMKADGIWTKMKAIYPVVGGDASSHAVNLKTPGTFNLSFATGWTHSATGMTPTSSYANTGFNPLTQSLPRNSASMGVYNRTNTVIAAGHGQRVSNNFELFDPWNDGNVYAYINNGSTGFSVGVTNSLGLIQGSRTSSTAIAISRNNTITNGSSATTGDSNGNLWIGASNNGGTGTFFNNRQIAFFYIGEGFNNTEMQNIYTRVNTYQTALSRNV